MTTIVETLWASAEQALRIFAKRLADDDPTLRHELRRTANDAFLLRAYLSFRKRADGDEVAVTVDVQGDGKRLVVASDACTEDGTVIADGPSSTIPLFAGQAETEAALASWLKAFEHFLQTNEQTFRIATTRLS